ncbi:MAG TPA: SDR family oxidoreductase [Terracidiphilus sp.]|nr:SDR family oxidoreductase [Terracidiphilus sp.]
MNPTGNTILVTGGGSGIGRGLAEALHAAGNTVVIAGRRRSVLEETSKAHPGMEWMTLDIESGDAIKAFAAEATAKFPKLNVVINNAGIMRTETLTAEPVDLADSEAIVATNLLGPIRLTAALLPHFKKQSAATVITVSSGLAFVPLALTPTYCATKAAIHSYTESLRYQLKGTSVEVVEIIPPYVQTDLMGGAEDPRAMPLKDYLRETMELLSQQPTPPEILVERVKPLRFAAENGYAAVFEGLNSAFAAAH